MIRRPPRSTRTDTLYPYTTFFRSTSKCIGWFVRLFMVPRQTDNRPHTKMAFVQTVMQAIPGGPHLPAIRLINTGMGQYCAARVIRGRSYRPMEFGPYEDPGEDTETRLKSSALVSHVLRPVVSGR